MKKQTTNKIIENWAWEKELFDLCNFTKKEGFDPDRFYSFITKTRTKAKEEERKKLRGIIDEEIKEIEKEQPNRLKLQEIYASGRIDGLYFIRKTLKKKIKLVEKLE